MSPLPVHPSVTAPKAPVSVVLRGSRTDIDTVINEFRDPDSMPRDGIGPLVRQAIVEAQAIPTNADEFAVRCSLPEAPADLVRMAWVYLRGIAGQRGLRADGEVDPRMVDLAFRLSEGLSRLGRALAVRKDDAGLNDFASLYQDGVLMVGLATQALYLNDPQAKAFRSGGLVDQITEFAALLENVDYSQP